MDIIFDDSRDGKLIDDYLFSGYRAGSKADQQFARPIEDEDIFGIEPNEGERPQDDNSLNQPTESLKDLSNELNYDKALFSDDLGDSIDKNYDSSCRIFEEADEVVQITKTISSKNDSPEMDIDDVFLDDYSQDPKSNDYLNAENALPTSTAKPASRVYSGTTPCLAKLKMAQLKEKIRLQHLTRPIKPKELGHDIDESLELSLEVPVKQHDPNFEKILNSMSSKKNDLLDESINHLESIPLSKWEDHKREMRRRISAQKRKIWDQFQKPTTDDMDDEEELLHRARKESTKENEDAVEDLDAVEDEDAVDEDDAVDEVEEIEDEDEEVGEDNEVDNEEEAEIEEGIEDEIENEVGDDDNM